MHTVFHFKGLNALMLPPPHWPTGVKTLQTQDTLEPRHFSTIRLVPKCPDSSAPVPKCLADTLALVPNCSTSSKHICYN